MSFYLIKVHGNRRTAFEYATKSARERAALQLAADASMLVAKTGLYFAQSPDEDLDTAFLWAESEPRADWMEAYEQPDPKHPDSKSWVSTQGDRIDAHKLNRRDEFIAEAHWVGLPVLAPGQLMLSLGATEEDAFLSAVAGIEALELLGEDVVQDTFEQLEMEGFAWSCSVDSLLLTKKTHGLTQRVKLSRSADGKKLLTEARVLEADSKVLASKDLAVWGSREQNCFFDGMPGLPLVPAFAFLVSRLSFALEQEHLIDVLNDQLKKARIAQQGLRVVS